MRGTIRAEASRRGGRTMTVHESSTRPSLKYAPPDRADVIPAVAVTLALGVLIGVLVGIGAHGQFSALGAIGGMGVGVLLVVAWSLRDGLLTGEPRFALARRIALAFFAAGLVLAVL